MVFVICSLFNPSTCNPVCHVMSVLRIYCWQIKMLSNNAGLVVMCCVALCARCAARCGNQLSRSEKRTNKCGNDVLAVSHGIASSLQVSCVILCMKCIV